MSSLQTLDKMIDDYIVYIRNRGTDSDGDIEYNLNKLTEILEYAGKAFKEQAQSTLKTKTNAVTVAVGELVTKYRAKFPGIVYEAAELLDEHLGRVALIHTHYIPETPDREAFITRGRDTYLHERHVPTFIQQLENIKKWGIQESVAAANAAVAIEIDRVSQALSDLRHKYKMCAELYPAGGGNARRMTPTG